jgi:DNA-binding transcriptional LysR family regulator
VTAAGEAFAPYASDVVGLLEQGRRAAREAADAAARELRIAAVTTAAEYLAPPLMKAFAALHPDIRLTLEVANRQRVFRRLDQHDVDIVVGGRPPAGARIRSEAFLENELVLVTEPDDFLAAAEEPIAPALLAERTWLLREEGSGMRAFNEQFLADHELAPPVLTLGSNGAIKQAARAGLGISLVSRLAVALELEAGLLAEVPVDGIPSRRWFVHRSDVGPPRPLVDAFMAFVLTPEARAAIEQALAFSRSG